VAERHWLPGTIIATALAFAAACDSGGDGDATSKTTPAPPDATSTVATPSPAATAGDAAPPAVVEDGYTTEAAFPQLAFERMIEIALIPGDDDHAVVITQDGTVRRFSLTDPGGEPSMFLDLREKIIDDPGNEEGLLGIAFSPEYADDGRFYVYYSAGPPRRTVLERYTTAGDEADAASGETVLVVDQPFPNHNGGGLEFGPDGYLYLGLGDGGSGGDPQGNGQNTNTLLGKILRIDVSAESAYTIPPENPFAASGGAPEIFAYGFRNPWRITFDRETGDLWAGDVGQGTVEEVDLVTAGGNYGWNIMEGDICFREDDCNADGLVAPRAVYPNGDGNCSVTGGYVYRGRAVPELDGWYIFADYCGGTVWGLDTSDPSAQPLQLVDTDFQVPSFAEDAAGELYLITFNGGIQRLVRR
jgi:glucose/arabinose dehydrogenase